MTIQSSGSAGVLTALRQDDCEREALEREARKQGALKSEARERGAVGSAAPVALPKEEIVARLFEAFSRRELTSALELMHPDVVFQPMTAAVTRAGEPYRGHEGIRSYVADVERHWRQLTIRPKQIRAAGRAVVALGLVSGSGVGGSFEDAPTTWVVKFKDGLVAHVQIFSDERYVTGALTEAGTDSGDTRCAEAGGRSPKAGIPVSASIPGSASAEGACYSASVGAAT